MATKTESVTPEALAFFKAAENTLDHLSVRWQDEREYEDIKDYMQPLQSIAATAGVKLLSMTKRPFGVKYEVGGKKFHAYVTARAYGYKRIA